MKRKKRENRKRRGTPVSAKETSIIAALYISQPFNEGIYAKVEEEYEQVAKSEKGIRKRMSKPTIRKVCKHLRLEELRQKSLEKIRELYQQKGQEILKDNLGLVQKMKGIIVRRVVGDPDRAIPGADASFKDLDRFIRLESFLQGGPDSRPDSPLNIGIILDGNADTEQLQRELDENLAVLGSDEIPTVNRG